MTFWSLESTGQWWRSGTASKIFLLRWRLNIVEPQEAVASGDIEVAQIQVAPEQMHVWRTEVILDADGKILSQSVKAQIESFTECQVGRAHLVFTSNKTTQQAPGEHGSWYNNIPPQLHYDYAFAETLKRFSSGLVERVEPPRNFYIMLHGGRTVEPFIKWTQHFGIPALGIPLALAVPPDGTRNMTHDDKNLQALKGAGFSTVKIVTGHGPDSSKMRFMNDPTGTAHTAFEEAGCFGQLMHALFYCFRHRYQ